MSEPLDFSLVGLDGLLGKLAAVQHDVKYKGGRFALRKAAQLVRNRARQSAALLDDPETGRTISANIVERWDSRRFKTTGDLGFRVGVKHGSVIKVPGNPDAGENGPTPHWRLLEFGTEKMPAQPFMRKALADNVSAATGEFLTQYEKALTRAIRRAAKAKAT